MKKAGIVVNGYYASDAYGKQVDRIKTEFERKGIKPVIWKNNRAVDESTVFPFERAFFLDKDIVLARTMERKGIKLVNSALSIEISDDKGKTYVELFDKVRQQETIVRPKKYFYEKDERYLNEVAEKLGFPMVGKASRGSFGEQVELIKDINALYDFDERLGTTDGIFQKFRRESTGRSYRIICIGGKAVGAMELESENDFRSNAAKGGIGIAKEIGKEFLSEAEKAVSILGLGYCGVDMFCDEPVIIEVNSNAYFNEFESKTGINVAAKCVEYILKGENK